MTTDTFESRLLNEDLVLTLGELCRACHLSAEHVLAMVEEGVIEPQAPGLEPVHWRFQAICIKRVYRACRLERDLGINPAGAALVIDLLEEIDQLKARVRRLEAGRD